MKTSNLVTISIGVVGAYLAYRYAVQNLMIPDYLGLIDGYPRTQPELEAIQAALVAGQIPAGNGTGTGTGAGVSNGGGNGGAGTTPAGTGNGTGNSQAPVGSNGGGTGQQTQTTPSSGSVKDQIWQAAKGEANVAGGRLHFWSWNHFLPSSLAKPDPFSMSDAAWSGSPLGRRPTSETEVVGSPLTLDQYWAMVAPILGLSGLRGGVGGVNHWGSAASIWPGGGNSPWGVQ